MYRGPPIGDCLISHVGDWVAELFILYYSTSLGACHGMSLGEQISRCTSGCSQGGAVRRIFADAGSTGGNTSSTAVLGASTASDAHIAVGAPLRPACPLRMAAGCAASLAGNKGIYGFRVPLHDMTAATLLASKPPNRYALGWHSQTHVLGHVSKPAHP